MSDCSTFSGTNPDISGAYYLSTLSFHIEPTRIRYWRPSMSFSSSSQCYSDQSQISFYLQTFLLVLLVDRSWQDAATALWTFIATNFGLVIAAIVNHTQLTFFQALQVSNLVWCAQSSVGFL